VTRLSWEALGGDPAPGDPSAYDALSRDFAATAENAEQAHRALRRLQDGVDDSIWRGEAADAFRSEIGELPPKLEKLLRSYSEAAEGARRYGLALAELQAEARRIRDEADAASADLTAAEQQMATAADQAVAAATAEPAMAEARRRLMAAEHQLADLGDRRWAAEDALLDSLEEAGDLGIHNKPWYKKALPAVGNWVDDHADVLRAVSSGLKIVSAAAGVLSLIPVLTPIFAPIAVAAGGAALLIDTALVLTGNGDWKALAVDAAMMALPGAGRLASKAIGAARGGRVAASAAGAADELVDAGRIATHADDIVRVDRLVDAADRTVDVNAITPSPVWRTTDETLFRLDNRPPETIFQEGFRPRGADGDLARFTQTNQESMFVSTSTADDLYKHPTWGRKDFQYQIRAEGGVDVNATLPAADNLYAHEAEIAFPGGVHHHRIEGAWELMRDGAGNTARGQWVPNPGYVAHR
jgi:uncharacterized protein YukE